MGSPRAKSAKTMAGGEQFKLNTGASIPACGLGTWQSPKGEVQKAVQCALESGYRHIDCAWIYGNEAEVGEGLRLAGLPREEVFLTSKLWNGHHSDVEDGCRDSLRRLGVEYVDLYLFHWPVSLKAGAMPPPKPEDYDHEMRLETVWAGMEKLVDLGLAKAIGVSNCSMPKLQRILDVARIKPAMNQCEMHPYLAQPKLIEFCRSHDILMTAYAPLGSPARPKFQIKDGDPVLLEQEDLLKLAADEGRTLADCLIRWSVQRGVVVIPKSVTPARIASNFTAAQTPLSDTMFETLNKQDRGHRMMNGSHYCGEGSTFPTIQDLWDGENC
jgi:alcohol dehydrogenase (NADP+)